MKEMNRRSKKLKRTSTGYFTFTFSEGNPLPKNQKTKKNPKTTTPLTLSDSDKILEAYETSLGEAILKRQKLCISGKGITVERAPEPEEITWANHTVSMFSFLIRSTGTWIVTFFLLYICYLITGAITAFGVSINMCAKDSFCVENA